MEHLKVNPVLIIADSEQIALAAFRVNVTAGPVHFRLHAGPPYVFLQIIPEKPALQLHLKPREKRKHLIQCLLQDLRFDRLLENH